MRPPHPFRAPARVLALLLLFLAVPVAASGQPGLPGVPSLAPEARQGLALAAADTLLPRWQRALMMRLARGSDPSALRPPATDTRPAPPTRAPAADDGSWSEPDPGIIPVSPMSARDYPSAVYDPVRDRMVVFGGYDGSARNDVWALTLAGAPAWTQLTPDGTPPSARYSHTAIYDPVRDRMVVFGGFDGYRRNDVWTLSLGDTTEWTLLTPSGSLPNARYGHSAIYDPVRDRMVVFGGYDDWRWYNDVWALSLGGTPGWTALPNSPTTPGGRYLHSAIYDPVRDRMVVFGGGAGAYPANYSYGDAWALPLAGTAAWTMLSPNGASPGARLAHSAVYDPVRDRMIVFGGTGLDGLLEDTWAFPLAGTSAWTALAPDGTLPGARAGHGAIYDPVRDRMLVFAGVARLSPWYAYYNDVMALSLADTLAWTGSHSQPGVFLHSTIYDPVRDRMVVFGGDGASATFNDVWSLSPADKPTWTALEPTGTRPSARCLHSAIYDPVRERMVVFGGLDGSAEFRNDVWSLSMGDTPAWTRLTPTGAPPVGRVGLVAIYDPVRDRMVVFGGDDSGDIRLDDVWALSLAGTPRWTDLTPYSTSPGARMCHSAIYDPVRDRMVVFGGYGDYRLNDVWALSLAGAPAWMQLTPTGTPPGARMCHSAIYDPVRDRMVVFGGGGEHPLDDVWALSLAGTPEWTQLTPSGSPPNARYGHSAIYDPLRDRMMLVGGWVANPCSEIRSLTWGAPALAGVTCPADVVWTAGASSDLGYGVTNPYAFAQTADYTLASGRDWPGFPVSGSVVVGADGTAPVPLSVPVPDSAANGLNPLVFRVTLRGLPQHVTCSHNLHDVSTPVLLSLVSALADPDRVRLTWYTAGGDGGAVTVYRRVADAAWSALGSVSADGTGLVVYEDRQVTPGTRYGYRLGVLDQGREVFAGETWVDVPRVAELALAGVCPNPATVALAVAFSLPDAAPARLEAFDLAGRRVAVREVGPLGGGSHVVQLGERRSLAPGVYLVRLARGSRRLTARAVIVR